MLVYALTLSDLLPLLTSCGPIVAMWKEEVLLLDGRMILIDRTAKAQTSVFLTLGGMATEQLS